MSNGRIEWWKWLERRRATLFLLGGVFVLLDAIVAALPVVAGASFPIVRRIFSTGFILAFLGLLGLYPTLVQRNSWLARVGAFSVGLGIIGFSITVLVNIGQLAGVVAGELPGWLKAYTGLLLIGFVVGYLAFGVASLGDDRYPRSLGIVLVVPAILYVVLLIVEVAVGISEWVFLITGVDAVAILVIGYLLRREESPTKQPITTDEIA